MTSVAGDVSASSDDGKATWELMSLLASRTRAHEKLDVQDPCLQSVIPVRMSSESIPAVLQRKRVKIPPAEWHARRRQAERTTMQSIKVKDLTVEDEIAHDELFMSSMGFTSFVCRVPVSHGIWFYELVLVHQSEGGVLQVGWANDRFRPEAERGQGVGDDAAASWAFDGIRHIAWGNGEETRFCPDAPRLVPGDRVGCLLDLETHEMSFYVNGQLQGVAFNRFVVGGGLCPAFSISEGMQVTLHVHRHATRDWKDMNERGAKAIAASLKRNEPIFLLSPLQIACLVGNFDVLQSVLPHIDPRVKDAEGRTLLHLVCSSLREPPRSLVDQLLERGLSLMTYDAHGMTPLHCASRAGHGRLCEHLLQMSPAEGISGFVAVTSPIGEYVRCGFRTDKRDTTVVRQLHSDVRRVTREARRRRYGSSSCESSSDDVRADSLEISFSGGTSDSDRSRGVRIANHSPSPSRVSRQVDVDVESQDFAQDRRGRASAQDGGFGLGLDFVMDSIGRAVETVLPALRLGFIRPGSTDDSEDETDVVRRSRPQQVLAHTSYVPNFDTDSVTIHILPPELLLHIFTYLNLRDTVSILHTCKYWKFWGEDDSLWRLLAKPALLPSNYNALHPDDGTEPWHDYVVGVYDGLRRRKALSMEERARNKRRARVIQNTSTITTFTTMLSLIALATFCVLFPLRVDENVKLSYSIIAIPLEVFIVSLNVWGFTLDTSCRASGYRLLYSLPLLWTVVVFFEKMNGLLFFSWWQAFAPFVFLPMVTAIRVLGSIHQQWLVLTQLPKRLGLVFSGVCGCAHVIFFAIFVALLGRRLDVGDTGVSYWMITTYLLLGIAALYFMAVSLQARYNCGQIFSLFLVTAVIFSPFMVFIISASTFLTSMEHYAGGAAPRPSFIATMAPMYIVLILFGFYTCNRCRDASERAQRAYRDQQLAPVDE